jgi:hypothetical protein
MRITPPPPSAPAPIVSMRDFVGSYGLRGATGAGGIGTKM